MPENGCPPKIDAAAQNAEILPSGDYPHDGVCPFATERLVHEMTAKANRSLYVQHPDTGAPRPIRDGDDVMPDNARSDVTIEEPAARIEAPVKVQPPRNDVNPVDDFRSMLVIGLMVLFAGTVGFACYAAFKGSGRQWSQVSALMDVVLLAEISFITPVVVFYMQKN